VARTRIRVEPSTATQCTSEAAGRGRHVPEKWIIVDGPGSQSVNGSGPVICDACVTGEARQAITNRRRQQTLASRTTAVADETNDLEDVDAKTPRGRFTFRERYWGWFVLVFGVAWWEYRQWFLIAACAVWALIFFLLVQPMRCRAAQGDEEEPCREWARGLLRACGDDDHQERRNDAVLELLRERVWPPVIWGSRPAKGAVVGVALSVLLLASAPVAWALN
jgi:hypothetical protein